MSRTPCKRMIRRLDRKLARERDNYIPVPNACQQGAHFVDDDEEILPPGTYYVSHKEPKWPN